ncbi:hypothetical protein [Photobacterium proteolyticum]|uniref:hypothetical protein n=1 Tax=Photobacterium proteolyticum TaxID=1903952 RepID=UPI000B101132|nr:hypothetical protein [Photobacterium proteolyticum]
MSKKVIAIITCALLALPVSLSVSASGGSEGQRGFGQQYCKLPSGERIFVPWHICHAKGGKTTN